MSHFKLDVNGIRKELVNYDGSKSSDNTLATEGFKFITLLNNEEKPYFKAAGHKGLALKFVKGGIDAYVIAEDESMAGKKLMHVAADAAKIKAIKGYFIDSEFNETNYLQIVTPSEDPDYDVAEGMGYCLKALSNPGKGGITHDAVNMMIGAYINLYREELFKGRPIFVIGLDPPLFSLDEIYGEFTQHEIFPWVEDGIYVTTLPINMSHQNSLVYSSKENKAYLADSTGSFYKAIQQALPQIEVELFLPETEEKVESKFEDMGGISCGMESLVNTLNRVSKLCGGTKDPAFTLDRIFTIQSIILEKLLGSEVESAKYISLDLLKKAAVAYYTYETGGYLEVDKSAAALKLLNSSASAKMKAGLVSDKVKISSPTATQSSFFQDNPPSLPQHSTQEVVTRPVVPKVGGNDTEET